jgi:hypothetical protein
MLRPNFRAIGIQATALCGFVLVTSPLFAQESAPAMHCSSTSAGNNLTTQGAYGTIWGFSVCVADLDGTGKREVIVTQQLYHGKGFVIILNNNGSVRKKICWGQDSCPTVTTSP